MQLKAKIIFFILLNFILLVILYAIPINNELLTKICLIKNITGKECLNCGMTRAFLSVLHLNFKTAYQYNSKVIIVFPLTVFMYLFSWYKYINLKGENKNE